MKTFALAVCCILVGSVASVPAQSNLETSRRFAVTVDGVPVTGVRSVNRFESQANPHAAQRMDGMPSKASGAPMKNRKTFVITRTVTSGNDVLRQWHKNTQSGPQLRTVVVTMMNAEGQAVRKFTFNQCEPLQYRLSSTKMGKSDVAVEKLRVVCESER